MNSSELDIRCKTNTFTILPSLYILIISIHPHACIRPTSAKWATFQPNSAWLPVHPTCSVKQNFYHLHDTLSWFSPSSANEYNLVNMTWSSFLQLTHFTTTCMNYYCREWNISWEQYQTGLLLTILAIHGPKITKKQTPPGTYCLIILQPDHLGQGHMAQSWPKTHDIGRCAHIIVKVASL